jgi:hypothetical protein
VDAGGHIAETAQATNLHAYAVGFSKVYGDLALSGLSQGIPVAEKFSTNPAVVGAVGAATEGVLGATAAATFGVGKLALDIIIFGVSFGYCASR